MSLMTIADSSQSSLRRPNDTGLHRAGSDRWRSASKEHDDDDNDEDEERASDDRYWTVACAQIMRNFWRCGLFLKNKATFSSWIRSAISLIQPRGAPVEKGCFTQPIHAPSEG